MDLSRPALAQPNSRHLLTPLSQINLKQRAGRPATAHVRSDCHLNSQRPLGNCFARSVFRAGNSGPQSWSSQHPGAGQTELGLARPSSRLGTTFPSGHWAQAKSTSGAFRLNCLRVGTFRAGLGRERAWSARAWRAWPAGCGCGRGCVRESRLWRASAACPGERVPLV